MAKFGGQQDHFLPGVIWAYRKKKPSFILFGINMRSPTEVALPPSDPIDPTDLSSYHEKLMSLSSVKELAFTRIRGADATKPSMMREQGPQTKPKKPGKKCMCGVVFLYNYTMLTMNPTI